MSLPRRWRRARRRHPSAGVMAEHHVWVDHDDHGSTAGCECGQEFDLRFEPIEADADASGHLARMLARRLVGHLADDLDDAALVAVLERAAPTDELAAVLEECRRAAARLADAAGW